MEEEEKKMPEQAEQVEQPRGRAAFLEAYKGYHPDLTDEPDDDTMFDYARKRFGEHDELSSKYDVLNGANERLAAVVSEDPRFAQFIAMVARGENLMYALGKTFGNLVDQLDDAGLEELRKGQEEYKADYQRVRDNFSNYETALKAYAEENGIDEERIAKVNDAILDLAEAFMDRDISREVIDVVYHGLFAEEEKAALEAEKDAEKEVEVLNARNEVIEEIKGRKAPASPLPDITGGKTNQPIQRDYTPKVESLADALRDKED